MTRDEVIETDESNPEPTIDEILAANIMARCSMYPDVNMNTKTAKIIVQVIKNTLKAGDDLGNGLVVAEKDVINRIEQQDRQIVDLRRVGNLPKNPHPDRPLMRKAV